MDYKAKAREFLTGKLLTGEVPAVDLLADFGGWLVGNEIQELRSALRHVMYRTHPEASYCSGCELAKKQSELY